MKKTLLALSLLAGAAQAQEADQARYSCDIENYAGIDTSALIIPLVQQVYSVQRNVLSNVPTPFAIEDGQIMGIRYVTYFSYSQGLLIAPVESNVTLNFEDGSARTVALNEINISQLESPLVSYEINATYDITPAGGETYRFTYTGDNLVQGILNELPLANWEFLEGVSRDVTPTINCIDHEGPAIIAQLEKRLSRVEALHPELAIFDLPLSEAIESLPSSQRYSAYKYQSGEINRYWAIERIRRTGENTSKLRLVMQYINEER
ncbi:hypothetical protein [Pelagibaculum spongiae]|uniref:DUF3857 domain-containing protein n=1 Tax=Pelagibaculum spongiae TaxID=2080658 RepID=A0A2V1H7G0_9GAMM|nr:hypothetical protein [Pelagibaculum spongiae]PVZ72402.1 hypothetical protein DC094_05190 [Pelagibaculum spongiae]